MVLFFLIPLVVLFLFAFLMVTLYLIWGINLYVTGKSEKSAVKLRSGKITIMNSVAWLALIGTAAYFVFFDFFNIGIFF